MSVNCKRFIYSLEICLMLDQLCLFLSVYDGSVVLLLVGFDVI